ncbi:MAG TPA: T9SS type A sorting domain-containing protein [Bacteroidia bacterium]|nr:T9SS type A sorting domain-containing protein [Bacteroidia bacterium]
MQILNTIEQTASQYENPDSLLGHGISNFCAAHDSLVSVQENKVVDMFEVFPNPSSGKVYLKIKGIQNLNIKNIDVYNALGSIVSSMKISGLVSDYVVNLSSRPKGVYFIKINSDKGSTVKKVILD